MPLVTVFGRTEGAVLTALARGSASVNGRQIERLLGGTVSIRGVQGALARLTRAGLVLTASRQAETLYRANRAHLLWSTVETAMNVLTEFRQRIRDLANEGAPNGTAVVLYGSVERGEATADSDVDLLVVYPDDTPASLREDFVDELGRRVELWTGNPAQVIQITVDGLVESAGRGDALVDLWLNDSEVLIGELPTVVQHQ
ncbi:nucleotidyltransferase family protein [Cryobacterium sp. TMT1-2-2]|uniref:nucleotidyltransferase family protein n=1 Tax=Cryobacterium sp. TMT1-2-2 TaxID=1259233 RepID=UPI00141ADCF2|nr:nucleotidyltransferase domain-containing protein [Cryobacterium sp. TMT1-2-2]